MARSRAAASTALTLGIAVATLVAMGAILGGPLLADCPGASPAACLRDRLVAAPAEPPRPAGWIEAVATEYAPPPPAAAMLTAPTGTLAAAATPPRPEPVAPILLAPVGAIAATGTAIVDPVPVTAALTAPAGSLSAGVATVPPSDLPSVTLQAPEKTISSPVQVPKIEVKLTPPPVRFDPAFPNVVVLPAPATGADSSIRTLAAD